MYDMNSSSNISPAIYLAFESPWKRVGILMPHMNITFATANGGFEPGLAGCYAGGGFNPFSYIAHSYLLFVY